MTTLEDNNYVLKPSLLHSTYLDLELKDSFYNMTFEEMILKSFSSGKNFIIAKTKSLMSQDFDPAVETDDDQKTSLDDSILLKETVKLLRGQNNIFISFYNLYSIMPRLF